MIAIKASYRNGRVPRYIKRGWTECQSYERGCEAHHMFIQKCECLAEGSRVYFTAV